MKTVLMILWWVLTAITAFLVVIGLGALISGQVPPILCFLAALLFILPPIHNLLAAKISLIKIPAIRIIIWLALIIAGFAFGVSGNRFIMDEALCDAPQQGVCQQDSRNFAKTIEKLYLTGTAQHLKDGAPVTWSVKYYPEPDKSLDLESPATQLVIKDGKAQLEFTPKTLAVGTYDITPMLATKELIAPTKTFVIWDAQQDVDDRKMKRLKSSPTKLKNFLMCDPANDDACKTDVYRFKSDTRSIGFGVDLRYVRGENRLKLIWKYLSAPSGKDVVISTTTQTIGKEIGQFKYELKSKSELPAGKYELIVALDAENAEPIRREFTVEKVGS